MAIQRMRKGLIDSAVALPLATVLGVRSARSRDAVTLRLGRGDCAGEPLAVSITPGLYGDSFGVTYDRFDERVSYTVELVPVRQKFGGVRRLLKCPLLGPDRTPCRRRTRALYLPAGRRYFGCRWCGDLTYRSCQFPVASRLRTVARRLERCQRDLESSNVRIQARAVRDVRATLAALIGRLGGPPLKNLPSLDRCPREGA
jgi:hypothetical protein